MLQHLGPVADDDQRAHLRLQDAVDPFAQRCARSDEPQGAVERFRSGRRQPLLHGETERRGVVRTKSVSRGYQAGSGCRRLSVRRADVSRRSDGPPRARPARRRRGPARARARRASTAARSPAGSRAAAPRRAGAAPAGPGGPRRRGRPRRARPCRRRSAGRGARSRPRASTARSAPGSTTRTPPATLAYTSDSADRDPARRCSTASSIASRLPSIACATRRGIGARRLDDERLHLDAQRPRALRAPARRPNPDAPARRSARNSALGSATGCSPSARHLHEPELVGGAEPVLQRAQHPQRVVAVAFERQHGVDDVLEHARPGERAVLGDVADEQRRDAACPSRAARAAARRRAPARPNPARPASRGRARSGSSRSRARRARSSSTCASTAGSDVSRDEEHARAASVPSRSARSRTCAGDSSPHTSRHRAPPRGHRAERLEQQRALAHARLAADERDRARRRGRRRAPGRAPAAPVGRRAVRRAGRPPTSGTGRAQRGAGGDGRRRRRPAPRRSCPTRRSRCSGRATWPAS